MSQRPIIDAGPGLNFLSINKERLLFDTLGPLSAPETVRDEVLRKSRQDRRFAVAEKVWRKLPERLMQIIPDDQTPELAAVVHRMSGFRLNERLKEPKDLGKTMVVAHAVVAAEAGETVTVLIDDGQGARAANSTMVCRRSMPRTLCHLPCGPSGGRERWWPRTRSTAYPSCVTS